MSLEAIQVQVQSGMQVRLHPTSLQLQRGEVLGLIGPNGAGKSTLMRVLAGIDPHHAGQVNLDGANVTTLTRNQIAQKIAYLAQSSICAWPLAVEHLVALGREPHRQHGTLQDDDLLAIDRAMHQADVHTLIGRTVTALSGGERARVMLARALATEAPYLLVDEPTAGLDAQHQLSMMQRFRELAQSNCAVLVVLHDLQLAMRYCDRLLLMDRGRCVANGPASEVLTPEHLASVYGIQAEFGRINDQDWILPWSVITNASNAAD